MFRRGEINGLEIIKVHQIIGNVKKIKKNKNE